MRVRIKSTVVGIVAGILFGAYPAYACGGAPTGALAAANEMAKVCLKIPVDQTWTQEELDALTITGFIDAGEYQISPACSDPAYYGPIPTLEEYSTQ